MKKYLIEWETDFCDNSPELSGECIVTATNEQEARKIFNSHSHAKQQIINITERKN